MLLIRPAVGETLGQLEIKSLLLQPTMSASELKQGGFDLSNSHLKLKWDHNSDVSGHLALGSKFLRTAPIWQGGMLSRPMDFALTEAYAIWDLDYLQLELGLQSVPYGYTGVLGDEKLSVPFQLIEEALWVSRRDFGFSIYSEHRGYTTELMAFNGESGYNEDQEAWIAGAWTFDNRASMFGISGVVAQVTPQNPTVETSVSWIPTFIAGEKSKFRLLNGFVKTRARSVDVLLEFHKGELIQETQNSLFDAWTLALDWELSQRSHIDVIVEGFDPDQGASEVRYRRASLGYSYRDANTRTQYGFLAQQYAEFPEELIQNDRLLVYVRFAPQTR